MAVAVVPGAALDAQGVLVDPAQLFSGQFGAVLPTNIGTGLSAVMNYAGVVTQDGATSAANDSDGIAFRLTSGATIGDRASIQIGVPVAGPHARQFDSVFRARWKLVDSPIVRFFVGLTGVDRATLLALDDPGGDYVGIEFSALRDTNWQFQSGSFASGQLLVDSGVAIGTAAQGVRVTAKDATPEFKVELLDAVGAVVASNTFTTNIPPTGGLLAAVIGLATEDPALKRLSLYYAYGTNRV